MSGRGKGGFGKGKGGMKRKQTGGRNNILGITKPAIRRLARRGGVARISDLMYGETRETLREFLVKVLGSSLKYTACSQRKTVTVMDIMYGLKFHGHTLYGFGG